MNFAKEIAGLPGLMKTSAEQLRKVPRTYRNRHADRIECRCRHTVHPHNTNASYWIFQYSGCCMRHVLRADLYGLCRCHCRYAEIYHST